MCRNKNLNKLCVAIFYLFFLLFLFLLKTNSHLLQLFRRMLQHCFAVKKCFVDHKTSPDFASVLGLMAGQVVDVVNKNS